MKNESKTQLPQKQRLRKIKTQYDESAKINYDLLYQETKQFHKNQIRYAKYVDKLTDQIFSLKPIEIGFVQSLTLKDDPKFKEIRHLLQKYNQEVLQYNQKSAAGLHLKTVVMDSMLKFMRLMLQAPDATAKKLILDVSYYWFKKNLDTSKQKKRTKNSLQKQIRTILLQSNLIPKKIIQNQLPSNKRQHQLYHYKIKARTQYKELNAPQIQIQDYITHKLGFISQGSNFKNDNNQMNSSQILKNKTKDQLRQQKWKKRIIFKKPYIDRGNYDEIEEGQFDQKVGNEDNFQNGVLKQKKENNIISQTSNFQGQKSKTNDQLNATNSEQNPNVQQSGQPVETNANEAAMQQFDLGVPNQQDPADDQPYQPQQQENTKKRGKLDPLVKIFLLDRQKRLKTQGEISADNRFLNMKNLKQQEKKIDENNAKFMVKWAGTRSRFKSQLSRKIQSIRAFTSISKAREQITTSNNLRVQNAINKARLNQTLKQYGAYIHNEPVRENLNTDNSISLHDRKRIKTQASSGYKPFSSVIQDRKRIDQKTQYIEEIQMLKEKFAKYKLYTPLDNFKKAIIHPQEKQGVWAEELDKLSKDKNKFDEFPHQLMSNPFANFGKKKKKKGKKKK